MNSQDQTATRGRVTRDQSFRRRSAAAMNFEVLPTGGQEIENVAILDAEVRDDTCTDHAQQRTGHAQHMRTLTTAWTLYTRPLIQGLTVLLRPGERRVWRRRGVRSTPRVTRGHGALCTLTETVTPYPMYAFRFTRKHEIEPAQRRARTSQLLKPQCAGAPSTAVICTARLWLR